MDRLQGLLNDVIENFQDEESLIDDYTYNYGKSPEEIVLEKERWRNLVYFLQTCLEYIDDMDKQILELYIIRKWTQQAIAIKLRISQQAVNKRLIHISEKIKNNFNKISCKMPNPSLYIYEDFFSENNDIPFTSNKLTAIKYPFEIMQNSNNGGYWGKLKYRKNKQYNTKSICKLYEYFSECFSDGKTVCTLFDENKCKNTKKHQTNERCKP